MGDGCFLWITPGGQISSCNGPAGGGDRRLLKITEQCGVRKDSIVLTLEGRLAGPWVEELNALWNTFNASQRVNVLIDLSSVTFIDSMGKTLLDRMWQQGAKLRAAGCLTRCIVEEITGGIERDEEIGHDERRCS